MHALGTWVIVLTCAASSEAAAVDFKTIINNTASSGATAMVLDPSGDIYVTGTVPNGVSAGNIFVMKWDPTGTQLLYSTYLGTTTGNETSTAIAIDGAGNAYITGFTQAASFPVTSNAFQKSLAGMQNAFVAKISADGSQVLYSTYFAGGTERATAIAIDSSGAAYITGAVQGPMPVTSNAFQPTLGDGTCPPNRNFANPPTTGDAFIAKISGDGSSLVYSSYLGGVCSDSGSGIVVNADASAWVVGTTFSPNFPVTSNALEPVYGQGWGNGFIARVSPAGDQLEYSSYLGGGIYDEVNAITEDSEGNLYLTGSSAGFSLPASPGAYQTTGLNVCAYFFGPPVFYPDGSAFVLILNPTATAVTGLTYLGGICDDAGTSIALDPSGAIWVAGQPGNVFPLVNPVQIQTGTFLSKFSADLTQLLFSTEFDGISGLAIDSSGKAVVAGQTDVTPVQAYVAKIDPRPSPITLDNVASASVDPEPPERLAPGKVVRLEGSGLGPSVQTPGLIANGAIATSVAGVQVTFNGIAAALLYLSATEIECIVPWEVQAGSETTIQVTYNGVSSNTLAVPVLSGPSSEVLNVLNEDGTNNSESNPAAAGSPMAIYLTGAGQTIPASVDNQVYANPLPVPVHGIQIGCGGYGVLNVTAAVAAPGLATGILQVNFQAPLETPLANCQALVNGFDGGIFAIWVN